MHTLQHAEGLIYGRFCTAKYGLTAVLCTAVERCTRAINGTVRDPYNYGRKAVLYGDGAQPYGRGLSRLSHEAWPQNRAGPLGQPGAWKTSVWLVSIMLGG